MAMIIKKNEINASKKEVWDIISDIGAIQNFNPNVSKSFYTSEIKEGIGGEVNTFTVDESNQTIVFYVNHFTRYGWAY